MYITITPKAMERIDMLNVDNQPFLLLHYDTDDCGCGVNGLPTIRLVQIQEYRHNLVNSNNNYQVIVDRQQAVFFAKELKLDYLGTSFRLTSPEGMLNPIIPESDIMKDDVA